MKEQPPNVEPLTWILGAQGQARRHRASIVCWRNSRTQLWEMVGKHSTITLQPDRPLVGEPMRILGSTRQLVTCLVALKARVSEWCARLHASGLDCSGIDAVYEKHRATLERVDGWEVGGLFSGITQDPDALVATYRMLEKLSFGEIQSTASALSELGETAEALALRAVQ